MHSLFYFVVKARELFFVMMFTHAVQNIVCVCVFVLIKPLMKLD